MRQLETLEGRAVTISAMGKGFIFGYAAQNPEPMTWAADTGECFTSFRWQDFLAI